MRRECDGEPRIEEIVRGFLTVTCPKCGDQWTTPKWGAS